MLVCEAARSEYERALHYLQPSTEGWVSHAYTCSVMANEGIDQVWKVIGKHREITGKSRTSSGCTTWWTTTSAPCSASIRA